jgi:outer membrane immunogenic protein
MLKQKARAGCRSNRSASRSAAAALGRTLRFLAMKERPMRRVHGILSIASLILGMASPALTAVHQFIQLILLVFFKRRRWCPSNCPNVTRRPWQKLAVGLGMSGALLSPAFAGDYDLPNVPVLRGSAPPPAPVYSVGPATFTRWSGFYVGGNVSWGSATSDFSTATKPLVQYSLQHTTLEDQVHPSDFQVLTRGSAVAGGGGAFLGYNTQWQDLVLGVEATYTHTNMNTTASPTTVGRIYPSLSTSVNVGGTGNLDLTDFGTARGRAGYVLGNFLPYGFVGMAVARASYSLTSLVSGFQGNPLNADGTCTISNTCAFFSFSNQAGQSNALLWGYTVGAGLDWAVTRNVFVRGEFEFVQFAPISNISVSVASGRLGAGLKF